MILLREVVWNNCPKIKRMGRGTTHLVLQNLTALIKSQEIAAAAVLLSLVS
jgi:hypothetical protein